jgi:hypothetical protein
MNVTFQMTEMYQEEHSMMKRTLEIRSTQNSRRTQFIHDNIFISGGHQEEPRGVTHGFSRAGQVDDTFRRKRSEGAPLGEINNIACAHSPRTQLVSCSISNRSPSENRSSSVSTVVTPCPSLDHNYLLQSGHGKHASRKHAAVERTKSTGSIEYSE